MTEPTKETWKYLAKRNEANLRVSEAENKKLKVKVQRLMAAMESIRELCGGFDE